MFVQIQQVLSLATARSYGYCAKPHNNYYGGNDYADKYYDQADYSEYSGGYGYSHFLPSHIISYSELPEEL